MKKSTYDRLVTSVKVLSNGYSIAMMPIGQITCVDIQKYVNELTQRGYSLSTIKKQMRIVTSPLKQAAALHQIPADPSVGIHLPAKSNVTRKSKTPEAYTDEEQERLKKVLQTNERLGYAAIALMIETGMRVGECLALRWRDVQISRNRLTVKSTVIRLANKKQSIVQDEPKSASSNRTIPLTTEAISILNGVQERRNVKLREDWVFANEYGERLSYEALRYQTRCACRDANIEFRGEHVFRHTFATNCYRKGIDIKILSKLLGHADVNITYNIYVHLYGDGFDAMYESLVKNA